MRIYLDGILVVEGKEDASYLSNYVASGIVVVNGYELNNQTIEYLKNKKVIALLDPDEAGIKIRKKLNEILSNIINVEIDINKCTRNAKNGVAECEIDEILTKLKPYVADCQNKETNLKESDLFKLGLIGNKELRDRVCRGLKLGKCNGKTLYKRLISANVKLDELKRIVEECNGN